MWHGHRTMECWRHRVFLVLYSRYAQLSKINLDIGAGTVDENVATSLVRHHGRPTLGRLWLQGVQMCSSFCGEP